MTISRRGFACLCAAGVGTVAFGGAARAFGGTGDLLRPPVAASEDDFLSKCLRCYRCVSACHTNAIDVARLEDGLIEVKTPKMNFHRGYCDFCNECVKVCPTGAIAQADPLRPETGRIGVAVVDEERCLAFFNGCDVCVEKCPYEAISMDGQGHPVVDASKCNGCGICVYACPALVYRSYSGSDARGIEVVPYAGTEGE